MITSAASFDVLHLTTAADFKIGATGVDSKMTMTFTGVTPGTNFWLGDVLNLV